MAEAGICRSTIYQNADTQTNFQLTATQTDQFYRDGYLSVSNFASATEIEQIRQLLNRLFARYKKLPTDVVHNLDEPRSPDEVPRNLEILHCLRMERKLVKTQYFRKVKVIAKQLLGWEARFWFDHAILKPPYSNCATRWHQDKAYSHPERPNLQVSFWLPLQDVTLESGCLQFIPASHKAGLLPHYPIAPGSHALTTDSFTPSQAVAYPLNVGDFSVHLGHTLHYAGPNTTDKSRLAWILVFSVDESSRRTQLMRMVAPIGRVFLG